MLKIDKEVIEMHAMNSNIDRARVEYDIVNCDKYQFSPSLKKLLSSICSAIVLCSVNFSFLLIIHLCDCSFPQLYFVTIIEIVHAIFV